MRKAKALDREDRYLVYFLSEYLSITEFHYPGVAQLVARLLWEREAQVRAEALGNPGKPWDTWADSTFPLADNWSKIGVDHMFDHN